MRDKEKHKQWCESHREQLRKYKKNYYNLHKQQIILKVQKYYSTHKEARNQYSKQWYEENKEHIHQMNKQWRQSNKEKLKEQRKQYREDHREQIYITIDERRRSIRTNMILNKKFPDSHLHHVRNGVGIYIPRTLHKNITHCLKDSRSMNLINRKVDGWLHDNNIQVLKTW